MKSVDGGIYSFVLHYCMQIIGMAGSYFVRQIQAVTLLPSAGEGAFLDKIGLQMDRTRLTWLYGVIQQLAVKRSYLVVCINRFIVCRYL